MFVPETDWLKKWAEYTPGKLFLREYDRKLSWSYAEFNSCANALAGKLVRDFGLMKGDRLAVYSKHRTEYVLALFA